MSAEVLQRAWAHIQPRIDKDTSDGCWLWTAELAGNGYGRVKVKGIRYQVHRLAAAAVLDLDYQDRKQFACHKCDVKRCCNPEHLVVADASWNMRDAIAKGLVTPPRRLGQELCRAGHAMAETRRRTPSGWTYCSVCSREKRRARHRQRARS